MALSAIHDVHHTDRIRIESSETIRWFSDNFFSEIVCDENAWIVVYVPSHFAKRLQVSLTKHLTFADRFKKSIDLLVCRTISFLHLWSVNHAVCKCPYIQKLIMNIRSIERTEEWGGGGLPFDVFTFLHLYSSKY